MRSKKVPKYRSKNSQKPQTQSLITQFFINDQCTKNDLLDDWKNQGSYSITFVYPNSHIFVRSKRMWLFWVCVTIRGVTIWRLYSIFKVLKFAPLSKRHHDNIIPLRLRKAGRVCCCGAQETHWLCHNEVTPSKTKDFLRSPCFFRSQWYLQAQNIDIENWANFWT